MINDDLSVDLFTDALSVLATSATLVTFGLQRDGWNSDEAAEEAVGRTAAYYGTITTAVRAALAARPSNVPYSLRALAASGHAEGDPRLIALGRSWLTHRGTPNLLVRPYVN
jgi:hypothetical protein